ncbi:M20/M25/M40 family metallo-hydrolase [Usitatibacter palustris]|uniref:Carboxypeptidase G2 n=1 Tax=Usitatibacter palustris TaxID=2732487 RepID=A0A6M4H9S6_9PROT|nr:M20/M25/M40 family metallo-hydrolase [Usitatibacter palustris]QJR15473.1 Carboxypeptidase G2 [Usitatibacter palustris]
MNHALRALAVATTLACCAAFAQPVEPVLAQVRAHKQPFLDTLKDLTAIESGSRDIEGLDRIAALIAERLKALGGQVELVAPADVYRMEDTPEQIGKAVRATFKGKGTKKLLMIAHMDTVYIKGMGEKQPFRIDGDKAYGLGIADDKQGIALILHAIRILKDTGFEEYGTLTVLINGDEEISSPGHRALITRLGAEHDATMSFEGGGGATLDQVRLATAGIAGVTIKVKGKASHAGSAPERGVNALYELSHQILQMKDFSDPATGLKMNWTTSKSGTNRNVIPAEAEAMADIRVLKVSDFEGIETKIREKAKTQLIADAKVEVVFDRRRPPLEAPPASIAFANHAQQVYKELGKNLNVATVSTGGGTDAAFAALRTKNSVVEGFGLRGFGAHSNDAEYIFIDSIEPRLYLAVRMIMDFARGKVAAQ